MMFTLIPVDPSSFDPAFASFLPQYRHPPRCSRVLELLHTNKSPPAFEHDRLTALIGSGESHLADIDKKIAAARHLLHFLLTERDQIASNLSDAKILAHPVRRLPDDILGEIFSHCVPALDAEMTSSSLDPRQAPWTLSQICTSWRRVALRTGRLWSTVAVNMEKDVSAAFQLSIQLSRAQGHDLSVHIFGSSIRWDGWIAVSVEQKLLFQTLCSSAPNWSRLTCSLPYQFYEFLSTFKGFLGRLEYLHTRIACMRGIDAAATLDTFSMTPLLRNLIITGTPYTGHTYAPSFAPSRTVNVLRLDILSLDSTDRHLNMLRSFPHARDIKLFCKKSQIALGQPLILPCLSHLSLTEQSGYRGGIADMLSRVVSPCITHISFATVDAFPSRPHILDFPDIRTSDWIKKIMVFELGDFSTAGCLRGNNANATIAFLRELPHLRQLAIQLVDLSLFKRIIVSLVFSSARDDNVASRLVVLVIRTLPALFDGGSLVTAVASRRDVNAESTSEERRSCSCLRRVHLERPLSISDPTLASQWEALCNSWLKVTYE
ncbi:hypothetical protein EV421DRAFT_1477420 [Armillaria borealis]|uniref:F-box domain-containing protein n=1 Tax=Armillaria borealis TaxID=47425 RepID=A0AA39JVP5_9AGAR|nr:hypothetical protein EV421DRAFT_1477420 [Armillaria borealis]